MRARAFDKDSGTWFQSHVLAVINSGWYEKRILISPCGYIKVYDGVDHKTWPQGCAQVQDVSNDMPTDWIITPYEGDVDKQIEGFEDFPERLYWYHGYPCLLEDRDLLLRLLRGEATSTDKIFDDKLPGWNYVYTQQDADDFLKQAYGLHDCRLTHVDYYLNGIIPCACVQIAQGGWCESIELVFEAVTALNLRPPPSVYDDYIYCSSLFVQDAEIFFCDDRVDKPDVEYDGTWIKAYGLRWRFIEQKERGNYMTTPKLFTSESVTEGHPDKLCDAISDAVLDAILAQDPMGRVACECATTTGMVLVMGEISTSSYVDIPKIARQVITDIGYTGGGMGFDGNSCAILTAIDEQSPDIALGVDNSLETKAGDEAGNGAGDQGLMFGYACNETPELMPLPISLAHALARQLTLVRKNGTLPYLRPDGKTQVTIEYDENDNPVRVDAIVVSSQHCESVSLEQIRADVLAHVIEPIVPANLLDDATKIYVNPTGRFVVGGPQGDSGLTGRKIIVDTYGGYARHGGGAFSGKDPTKVDRSAAYAARYVAKNIVAAGLAKKCEVQLAYAIGVAKPVSVRVDTFGTAAINEAKISALVQQHFDLRPTAIINRFNLRRPIYRQLAALGHVGRTDVDLPWEALDMVDTLKKAL